MRGVMTVLVSVILFAWSGDCHAQQVRVRVQHCSGGSCYVDYGNGVVVGNNDGLLVLTCEHVVRQQGAVSVYVDGSWYPAEVYQRDQRDDVAAVAVPGDFRHIPYPNWVSETTAPPGSEVEIRSYWPGNWQPVSRRMRRLATRLDRCLELQHGVPSGVSGSPVYSSQGLIGIVSAADDRSTIVVPITVIRQHYRRWGLFAEPTPARAQPVFPLASGPSPLAPLTPSCNCQTQITAVEQRLALLDRQLSQLLNAKEGGRHEITALNSQVQALKTEISRLKLQSVPGERGPQGPAGPAGTVTVVIKDSGKQIANYEHVQSGSTVEVDINRFLTEE